MGVDYLDGVWVVYGQNGNFNAIEIHNPETFRWTLKVLIYVFQVPYVKVHKFRIDHKTGKFIETIYDGKEALLKIETKGIDFLE